MKRIKVIEANPIETLGINPLLAQELESLPTQQVIFYLEAFGANGRAVVVANIEEAEALALQTGSRVIQKESPRLIHYLQLESQTYSYPPVRISSREPEKGKIQYFLAEKGGKYFGIVVLQE